jgi:hypothetical protein
MNVEIETEAAQFPEKGMHKWYFSCSAQKQKKCLGKEKVGAGKRLSVYLCSVYILLLLLFDCTFQRTR